MVFNGTGVLDVTFQNLSGYVFGSNEATGVFFIVLLFVGMLMLRIDFEIALIALLPMIIVFYAFGMINPLVAGLIVVFVFFAVGGSFLRQKQ